MTTAGQLDDDEEIDTSSTSLMPFVTQSCQLSLPAIYRLLIKKGGSFCGADHREREREMVISKEASCVMGYGCDRWLTARRYTLIDGMVRVSQLD